MGFQSLGGIGCGPTPRDPWMPQAATLPFSGTHVP